MDRLETLRALVAVADNTSFADVARRIRVKEVAGLMPLGRPFDGFVEHSERVSPTSFVHFERNRYVVPASFANRPVSLRM